MTRRYGPVVLTFLTIFLLARFAPSPLDVDPDLADRAIGEFGSSLLSFVGIDDSAHQGQMATPGSALTGWAESRITVVRTGAKHSSRPASFGSHLSKETDLLLFPLSAVNVSDQFGCKLSTEAKAPKGEWAALVQRGDCSFSQKARLAQRLGAKYLLYGDESESEGGVPGGGLLTPWSPDDTSDITIASAFVNRASYLSLLATFEAEQRLPLDLIGDDKNSPRGLMVTFSKDEILAWPFLDLLLMLLFLPTLLTLLTVFTHRLRLARQRSAERAPREAIEALRVFAWQVPEKPDATIQRPAVQTDEEAAVGETTPLLRPSASTSGGTSTLQPQQQQPHPQRASPPLTRHWRIPAFFYRLPFVRRKRAKVLRKPIDPARAFVRSSECAICLSDFEKGDMVIELPCLHLFHRDEVVPWLAEQRGVCPVCRTTIFMSEPTTPAMPPQRTDESTVPPVGINDTSASPTGGRAV